MGIPFGPLASVLRDALLDLDMQQPDSEFDPLPGRFRFLRRIGEGGWGVVWAARDINLGRLVAIKVIRRDRAQRAAEILRNEGVQLARVRAHPNIVQVYSWEQAAGVCFVVLQYVAGGSLRKAVETLGPLKWPPAIRYASDIADGLLRVHEEGVLHRDIKPDNVLLDVEQDQALLTDFGFAGTTREMKIAVGTPGYAAPEALSAEATPASDVFSLAATLYHLVVGHAPFTGQTVEQVFVASLRGLGEPIPASVLPPQLGALVGKALSREPADRPSLSTFRDELRGVANLFTTDTLFAANPYEGAPRPPTSLRVTITKLGADGTEQPVPVVSREARHRDLGYVPKPPMSVRVLDGDRLRIRLEATEDGFVTLLNVGPAGVVTVLLPNSDLPELRVRRGVPVAFPPPELGRIEVRPPPGRERVVAIWTRTRPDFDVEALYADLMARDAVPENGRAYCSTRQLVYVSERIHQLSPEHVACQVLELDHSPS